ncbi:caspase-2-like isoform X1 [Sinocyclocheilus rhinocerous]|uniref:caspase-2-like isoform X1 n=1 Tax=Sinocyclocheilus rhinocerous TaxID=307959 RepID=UPI0007BA7D66|nr:PREDICTED: caspase-2-like isoform X1 [Sinocyclocheilus rhinocerous]XP_016419279.1 PREDICTED: caspase-2-like isoform X1 [Sinocyclocheilus rhinocerous]
MLGDCGMKEWERLALRKNSVTILQDLVVDDLLIQCLQQDGILTENMAETIMAKPTSQGKSHHLLFLLPKRGPQAFSSFCAALMATEQQHLCRLLMDFTERDRSDLGQWNKREGERVGLKGKLQCSNKSFSEPSLSFPTQECVIPAKRARTHESMEMCLDADSPVTTAVLPCTPEFYQSHRSQAYPMRSCPRGLALVLSNVRFDSANTDLDVRRGGEVDEETLRRLFMELDFTVSLHKDLTAEAMRRCLEQFAQRQEHAQYDCTVVCLLSHGIEGSVYGTDGQLLELDWVFEVFDNTRCPLLQNKPKMFFIQACRGEEMDSGVDQLDGQERTQSPGCEQRDAGREGERDDKEREEKDRERLRVKLPQRSDMICGFATLKGFSTAAMRNTKKGSWFIQELNSVIRQRANDTHLADILVQVNSRIKSREGYAPGSAHHRCKEMSEFTSSLCKDLYLFPKYYPNN